MTDKDKVMIYAGRWRDEGFIQGLVVHRSGGLYVVNLDYPARGLKEYAPVPSQEGITWCYGWEGPAVDALKAAQAMR